MGMKEKYLLALTDDVQLGRQLALVLPAGIHILKAASCQNALDSIERGVVRAMIIDSSMKEVDGLAFLSKVKRLAAEMPVAYIAVNPSPDLVISTMHLGIADFLAKPVSIQSLKAMVERLSLAQQVAAPERSQIVKPPIKNSIADATKNICKTIAKFLHQSLQFLRSHWLKRVQNISLSSVCRRFKQGVSAGTSCVPKPTALKPNSMDRLAFGIQLLGTFQVTLNGKNINGWPGQKSKLLFAYLCYHHRHKISKDVLMELFWPGSPAESARNSLNVALHGLRHWLAQNGVSADLLNYKEDGYCLHPDANITLDTEEFSRTYKTGQRLEKEHGLDQALKTYEQAAAFYKGDFLAEYPYESWADLDRENLRDRKSVV